MPPFALSPLPNNAIQYGPAADIDTDAGIVITVGEVDSALSNIVPSGVLLVRVVVLDTCEGRSPALLVTK